MVKGSWLMTKVIVSRAEATPAGTGVAVGAPVGIGVKPAVASGAEVGVASPVVTWAVGTGVAGAAPAQATANTAIAITTVILQALRFLMSTSTSLRRKVTQMQMIVTIPLSMCQFFSHNKPSLPEPVIPKFAVPASAPDTDLISSPKPMPPRTVIFRLNRPERLSLMLPHEDGIAIHTSETSSAGLSKNLRGLRMVTS
jgi:hypothetical protein